MSIGRWLRSRPLLFKFGVIHGAGALFTLAVILLTRVFAQQLASGTVAVNYAGQERYRSYELLFLVSKMVEDPSKRRETRELLRLKQAEFERILTGLRTGDPNLGLDAPPEGPVTARLAAFDLKYREEIEPVVDRVIAVDDEGELRREREKLVDRVPGFVLAADRGVSAYEEDVLSKLGRVRRIQLALLAGLAAGAAMVMLVVVRWILRPLGLVMTGMRQMTEGRLNLSIPVGDGDEISQLAEGFNTMAANLASRTAELERASEDLRVLAVTDGLTGLYNHRHFLEAFASEAERSRRYNAPLAVLMIDIDHFKEYNDQNGHLAGDRALAQVAQVISAVARSVDVVCRYGGEEFAAILPNTGLQDAGNVAEKMRASVEACHFDGEPSVPGTRLTVSVGYAAIASASTDWLRILQEADQALYRAKADGRNRVAPCP